MIFQSLVNWLTNPEVIEDILPIMANSACIWTLPLLCCRHIHQVEIRSRTVESQMTITRNLQRANTVRQLLNDIVLSFVLLITVRLMVPSLRLSLTQQHTRLLGHVHAKLEAFRAQTRIDRHPWSAIDIGVDGIQALGGGKRETPMYKILIVSCPSYHPEGIPGFHSRWHLLV